MKNSTVALKTGEENQNSCRAQREHLGKKESVISGLRTGLESKSSRANNRFPKEKSDS